jgi:hypothetical protein
LVAPGWGCNVPRNLQAAVNDPSQGENAMSSQIYKTEMAKLRRLRKKHAPILQRIHALIKQYSNEPCEPLDDTLSRADLERENRENKLGQWKDCRRKNPATKQICQLKLTSNQ